VWATTGLSAGGLCPRAYAQAADAQNGYSKATAIDYELGQTVQGELSAAHDKMYFRVQLSVALPVASVGYEINLKGKGAGDTDYNIIMPNGKYLKRSLGTDCITPEVMYYYNLISFANGVSYIEVDGYDLKARETLDFTLKSTYHGKTMTAPTLELSNTAAGVKATWSAVQGASRYCVWGELEFYYKGKWRCSWCGNKLIVDSVAGTSYVFTNKLLTHEIKRSRHFDKQDGVKYDAAYLNVYVYMNKGTDANSKDSSLDSAAHDICWHKPPRGVKATKHGSAIKVSWHNVFNETGYKVYRCRQGSTSFKRIATVRANTTSYIDRHAKKDVVYLYKVKAYNAYKVKAHQYYPGGGGAHRFNGVCSKTVEAER
jgi:hypothetical protein